MANTIVRFLSFALALAVLAVVHPAAAQRAETPNNEVVRFGVIDVQKILRQAAATRAIRPQIEKLKKEYQSRFKREEDALRAADQDLQRKRALLSPEAFEQERRDFQRRATELQRKVQEARRELDESLGAAMSVVERAVGEIVTKLASEQKIQFILHRPAVMLMDERFDITDEVLKRLNAKLPSVTVKAPARKRSKTSK